MWIIPILMSLLVLEKRCSEDECISLFRSFVFKMKDSVDNDLNEVFDEAYNVKIVTGTNVGDLTFHSIKLQCSHSEWYDE